MSKKRPKDWRTRMEEFYKEINELSPTYEEIEEFVKMLEEANDTYGVITYTKRDDNPLYVRLHNTWKMKLGGRLHIDVISGEYHLMLDYEHAKMFIEFIKRKRNIS